MPAVTPVYGWPFQSLNDPPDGPNLGEDLALAIEATVVANNTARISGDAALAALAPYTARVVLSGSAASVVFSSIPATLRRLQFAFTARGDAVAQVQGVNLRINGDATANYSYQVLQGSNATVSAAAGVGTTFLQCGLCTGSSAAAGIFGGGEFTIHGWDLPHPSALGMDFNSYALGVGAGNFVHSTGGGHWIAPIGTPNSITLLPGSGGNFVAGTDFQLTGW